MEQDINVIITQLLSIKIVSTLDPDVISVSEFKKNI